MMFLHRTFAFFERDRLAGALGKWSCVQDGLKMAQEGSRWPQDGPKMAPRWPKTARKWAQDGPKIAPRWLKMAPTWPKMTQDGSKILGLKAC